MAVCPGRMREQEPGTDEVQKLEELGQAESSGTWTRYWPFSLGQWKFTEGFLSGKVT